MQSAHIEGQAAYQVGRYGPFAVGTADLSLSE